MSETNVISPQTGKKRAFIKENEIQTTQSGLTYGISAIKGVLQLPFMNFELKWIRVTHSTRELESH